MISWQALTVSKKVIVYESVKQRSEPMDKNDFDRHCRFMDAALEQAQKAGAAGEVPIGAVVANMNGEILGTGFNQCIRFSDPTAHAEILAIREAARHVENYRLLNAALYVTNEPCIMCMGAVIHARLALVVYGAKDPGWGAAGSVYDFAADRRLNHAPGIIPGIRESQCRDIIVNFFAKKRNKQP